MVKITFALPEDNLLGSGSETLWAERIDDGKFKIANVPFLAMGVNWGDVVLAKAEEGRLVFSEILIRGGHSTFRVYFLKNKTDLKVQHARLLELFGESATHEGHSDSMPLYAIDVLPGANTALIIKDLDGAQKSGELEYDIGFLAP